MAAKRRAPSPVGGRLGAGECPQGACLVNALMYIDQICFYQTWLFHLGVPETLVSQWWLLARGEVNHQNSKWWWMWRQGTYVRMVMMIFLHGPTHEDLSYMMIVMMNMTLLLIISHLIPALPWPQDDFARSSSNMLFHTARLTEDKRMMMMVMMPIIINHFAYQK